MEINFVESNISCDNTFKIDLIVWKFNQEEPRGQSVAEFKIDLIVWKWVGSIPTLPYCSSLK